MKRSQDVEYRTAVTILRIFIAGAFLAQQSVDFAFQIMVYSGEISPLPSFVVAATTDFIDGYLARKWNAESMFGRIMDPFCDKVLVLGAFIYLRWSAF